MSINENSGENTNKAAAIKTMMLAENRYKELCMQFRKLRLQMDATVRELIEMENGFYALKTAPTTIVEENTNDYVKYDFLNDCYTHLKYFGHFIEMNKDAVRKLGDIFETKYPRWKVLFFGQMCTDELPDQRNMSNQRDFDSYSKKPTADKNGTKDVWQIIAYDKEMGVYKEFWFMVGSLKSPEICIKRGFAAFAKLAYDRPDYLSMMHYGLKRRGRQIIKPPVEHSVMHMLEFGNSIVTTVPAVAPKPAATPSAPVVRHHLLGNVIQAALSMQSTGVQIMTDRSKKLLTKVK